MRTTHYHPGDIVQLLETPIDDRRPLISLLQRDASIKDLIQALWMSKLPLTRSIICDILGARRAKSAIPVLIKCLDDPNWKVCSDAAEALFKIGAPNIGREFLKHFRIEPLPVYAFGLGSLAYRDAIPDLIIALQNESSTVRGGAAYSLGIMHANEAIFPLLEASRKEMDVWVLNHINKALENIYDSYK